MNLHRLLSHKFYKQLERRGKISIRKNKKRSIFLLLLLLLLSFKSSPFRSEASLLCQRLGRKSPTASQTQPKFLKLLKTFPYKNKQKKDFIHKRFVTKPSLKAKKKTKRKPHDPPIAAVNQLNPSTTVSWQLRPSHDGLHADQLWCEDAWGDAIV